MPEASKSSIVAALIAERYPCGVMPKGAVTALAAEIGCSRGTAQIGARLAGAWVARQVRKCAVCLTAETQAASGICRACLWVEIPCESCGEAVRRRASSLAWHQGRTTNHGRTYTGRVFCNRVCFGRWCGKSFGVGTEYQK